MKNTLTLEQLRAAIEPFWLDYDYIGLRVQCPVEAKRTRVGSRLRPSHEWVDGDKTRRKMCGTAAFGLRDLNRELPLVWAEMQRLGYVQNGQFARLVVIGSNDGSYREDMPERYATAIQNAVLLAVAA